MNSNDTSKNANAWFDYVVSHRKMWCHGFTLKRLERVKAHVFADKDIMWDLMERHRGKDLLPDQLKEEDTMHFNHGIGNFTCAILYKMIDLRIIPKRK